MSLALTATAASSAAMLAAGLALRNAILSAVLRAFRSLRFACMSAAATSRLASALALALASALDINLRIILRTEFLVTSVSRTLAFLRATVHSTPLPRSRAAFAWLRLTSRGILLSTWRHEAREEAV